MECLLQLTKSVNMVLGVSVESKVLVVLPQSGQQQVWLFRKNRKRENRHIQK